MKNIFNKFMALLFIAVLCVMVTGCVFVPVPTVNNESTSQATALTYSLTYYYNIDYTITNGDYVSTATRQALNSFGKPQSITPASAVAETYTEIPEFENNAKGTDPICILLPDLDISKYRICSWKDAETGLTTGWYRIIGGPIYGMMTDEVVTYDIDSSGNLTQYKTVNLGKYDALELNESRLENLRKTFSNRVSKTIGTKQTYQYSYTTTSQTPFRMFTDTQDRLVITTTIALEQNGRTLDVDLYAVVS